MSPRPYRLGERAAAVAETRDRVVAAARDLLCEDGQRLRLDDVARRADVARATVYSRFGSKLGLVEAVLADLESRADLPRLVRVVEETEPAGLLRAVVVDGCRYWATDPPLARRILAVAAGDPEAAAIVARHDAGRLGLLRTVVARLAEADLLAVTAERAVDVLWLLTSFASYDTLARDRALGTADVATLLADLAEQQLRRLAAAH